MATLKIEARQFSLRHTLDSGQLFRWWSDGAGYIVCAGERVFRIEQRDDRLEIHGADADFVRRFFGLDADLDRLKRELLMAGFPADVFNRWRGLRIVRQTPWECLVSFVCSSANNIKRIRGMIDRLCERRGRPIRFDGRGFFAFPPPGGLGNARELRDLGFGFRAEYIAQVNRIAAHPWLAALERLDYAQAKERLMTLPGVGHKVGDCVLLFSLGHGEAFPIDTWVRRIVRRMFFRGRAVSDAVMRRWAQEKFGPNAGYAQQYLYHNARHGRKGTD